MKLRIKGNSLRLRLTKTEISTLASEGFLSSETDFGPQAFRYSIRCGDDAAPISATCEDNAIQVQVPAAGVAQWATSGDVGLYAAQDARSGGVLNIAIEKDFRCLDPRRDEDESDHFDNPLAGKSHHPGCVDQPA